VAGRDLSLSWSKARKELLMIMKLRNDQEESVTSRSHTLGPTIVLAAVRRFKAPAVLLAGLALLLSPSGVAAKGTFQNLDFESANIPSGTQPRSGVPMTNALPGWSATYRSPSGTVQAPGVIYDAVSLGGALICIIDPLNGDIPLQGDYSVYLFAGGIVNDTSSIISQTGLLPSGAMSLQVKMSWHETPPVITLGGQVVNMLPLQTMPNYTLYEGDISPFAGQVQTLSITESPVYLQVPPSWVLLDDIRFVRIPEPGIFTLSALGALLIGWRLVGRFRVSSSSNKGLHD
jgi:hypothetical protein